MVNESILKHLQDILDAINDLQRVFVNYPMRYEIFAKDDLRKWAVERKTEIMGEAMNRIRKEAPDFIIPNGKEVIKTRNRLIHGYDSIQTEFLWSLVIRHIPQLKEDIEKIIGEIEKDNNQ